MVGKLKLVHDEKAIRRAWHELDLALASTPAFRGYRELDLDDPVVLTETEYLKRYKPGYRTDWFMAKDDLCRKPLEPRDLRIEAFIKMEKLIPKYHDLMVPVEGRDAIVPFRSERYYRLIAQISQLAAKAYQERPLILEYVAKTDPPRS